MRSLLIHAYCHTPMTKIHNPICHVLDDPTCHPHPWMHIHCKISTISRGARVLSNREATYVSSTPKWCLLVWCSHMDVPCAYSLWMNPITHSWPCVTLCVTTNIISFFGVKRNVFHCTPVQNHECTLALTRAILLYAQHRNVQPNKNVCNPTKTCAT